MTQEALALACGWSGQSRIANYESDSPKAREPRVSEVPALAKALGVSIASLFGEAEKNSPPVSHAGRLDPIMLAEAIEALRRVARNAGVPFDPGVNAEATAAAYELRVALGANPSTKAAVEYGAQVAGILNRK